MYMYSASIARVQVVVMNSTATPLLSKYGHPPTADAPTYVPSSRPLTLPSHPPARYSTTSSIYMRSKSN